MTPNQLCWATKKKYLAPDSDCDSCERKYICYRSEYCTRVEERCWETGYKSADCNCSFCGHAYSCESSPYYEEERRDDDD